MHAAAELRSLPRRESRVRRADQAADDQLLELLLQNDLAREATPGNLKSIEHERKKWALLAQQEKVTAEKAATSVQGIKITVQKRVGENGQLFGSVTANEIADALLAKGIEVDKRRIELAHAIKSLGTHDVDVRLHREVTAHIQVEVIPIGVEKFEEAPAATPAQ